MAVANGQLLAYFWLITLTAVLAMVLGGEILIQIGGPQFESAAPIIPLTAAAMSMPALYRTRQQHGASIRTSGATSSSATILAAVLYVGFMLLLLSHTGLGIYTAPIAMMVAFLLPSTAMFLRSQLGDKPIDFPYLAMLLGDPGRGRDRGRVPLRPPGRGVDEAAGDRRPDAGLVRARCSCCGSSPRHHWHPIRHIALSALRQGLGAQVRPERGAGLAGAPRPRGAAGRGRRPPAARGAGALDAWTATARATAPRPATAPRRRTARRSRPRLRRGLRGGAAGPPAAPHRQARRGPDRGVERARRRHLAVPVLRSAGRGAPDEDAPAALRRGRAPTSCAPSRTCATTWRRTSPKVWDARAPATGAGGRATARAAAGTARAAAPAAAPRPSVKRA